MMKHFYSAVILVLFSTGAIASNSLSYSGRLTNTDGSPVTGPVTLKFEFAYSSATTVVLCQQQITGVTLANGVFHTKLDPDCSPLTFVQVLSQVPAGEAVAVRVTDETHAKSYSFQALHSMPFATIAKQLDKLGATSGQVLSWDGSKWSPVNPNTATGSVTAVATGAGLTGGPITNTGTISIADGGVTDVKIASGLSRSKLGTGTPNYVIVNNGSGSISEAAQLALTQGGTGSNTAAGARTNLGLGTAAVANIGTSIGNVMAANAVPSCLSFEKLQMTIGPTYAWTCVPDLDTADNTKLPLAGGTMSGSINMGSQKISNLAAPTVATDAATKSYVDAQITATSDWIKTSTDLSYIAGKVGVGINPTATMHISGTSAAGALPNVLTVQGAASTDGNGSQGISLTAGQSMVGRPAAKLVLGGSDFNGGSVLLQASQPNNNGAAGIVEIYGGNGWNNPGGNVYIAGGSQATNGNVYLGVTSSGTNRGNVGIGTTTANAKLEVSGQIVSKVYNNGSATTFNMNNGNSQFTSASCGAMVLDNIVDGASYTIAVQGATAGTCTFTDSTGTRTFRFSPANGATTASTHTIYSMQVMGSFVYVSWISGF